MNNRKAYTLIEVLLVVALLSIITGLAFPNTRTYLRIKEKKELDEFRKDILFARNKAIIESKNCFIYFNFEDNQYIIKHSEESLPIKTKKFPSGIELSGKKNVLYFEFNCNGSTNKSGTIYLTTKFNDTYSISLTPATGRLTMEKIKD